MASVLTVQEEAREWLEENMEGSSAEYDLSTKRINVVTPLGSFYILHPEGKDDDNWTVWSDDSSIAQHFTPHIDYFTSNKTLVQILEKIKQCITTAAPTASDSEEDDGEEEDDDDDEEYDYYGLDDYDDNDVKEKEQPEDTTEEVSADDFFTGDGSPGAVHRLLADLKSMNRSDGNFGISGHPRGDNLFVWDVQLTDFDTKSLLYKDLQEYAKKRNKKPVIEIEMKFPKDYPMNPPFVRVLRPRFQFLTGHVTIGGSICMQMLTRSGWSPSNDIESILVQVRAEIMSDDKARLDLSTSGDYSESEARQAFERMVHRYGWNK